MATDIDSLVLQIADRLYPVLGDVIRGRSAKVIQARIREALATAVDDERATAEAAMTTLAADMNAASSRALSACETRMTQQCRDLRAADATAAQLAQAQAVAATRQEERDAANERTLQAVNISQAIYEQRLEAARKVAVQAQAEAVAAARADEQSKCVAEIGAAPVTGITVALTAFAASMRTQIQNYVKTGPH